MSSSSYSRHAVVDTQPSVLWITIPPFLLLSAYFLRRWYLARRLRLHGIGKGAPGFQTNVRRIRVTPDIAARLKRGEDVSPEEIAAASARAEEDERLGSGAEPTPPGRSSPMQTEKEPGPARDPVNEWLPETVTNPKKRAKGKKK